MGGAERKEQKTSTGGGFEWKKPWNKFSKAVNILEKKRGVEKKELRIEEVQEFYRGRRTVT
jgi:hypothetical protein